MSSSFSRVHDLDLYVLVDTIFPPVTFKKTTFDFFLDIKDGLAVIRQRVYIIDDKENKERPHWISVLIFNHQVSLLLLVSWILFLGLLFKR